MHQRQCWFLAALSLLTVVTLSAHAAESEEVTLAREAATTFARAFNERAADDVLKVATVPFLAGTEPNKNMYPSASVLTEKQHLHLAFTRKKVEGTLPGTVKRVEQYDAEKVTFGGETDESKFLKQA